MNDSPASNRPSSRPTFEPAQLTAAVTGNRHRTVSIVVGLVVMAALLVWVVASVGVLIVHDRQDRRKEQARQAAGVVVIGDVYRALNDINGQLAAIRDQPAPTPIVPPTSPQRPTTTTARRQATTNRPVTTSTRPAQPPAASTTTSTSPRPSTTTTTRPRCSVPVVSTIPVC